MRVALLMSGYLRTFKYNVENIKQFLIEPFDQVDIYVHVTKDEQSSDRYLNPQRLDAAVLRVEAGLKPKCMLLEGNEEYSKDRKQNDVINTWAKYHKLNQLKKKTEEEFGQYDLVIKTRPDVAFVDLEFNDLHPTDIVIPASSKIDHSKLRRPQDPHVCDAFAYGPSASMDLYFGIHRRLRTLIRRHGTCPETLLYRHLQDHAIPHQLRPIKYGVILSSCNAFAIAGDSGSGKSTLGRLLKRHFSNSFLLECDRYHKWERGDDNWKSFTHLDPNANYLAKMSEDVFNLRIGESVMQVDYDHSTGKFTEPEKIDAVDNIIVCGLHSLYQHGDDMYNLKVFMDTADDLKVDWKCSRDVGDRGYSREEVLRQIESRREDYEKHVLPQREESDVIVRFYKEDDEVRLKMLVRRHWSIELEESLAALEPAGAISRYMTGTKKFKEIEFSRFKPHEDWSFTDEPDKLLYNYVLYILLNLRTTGA